MCSPRPWRLGSKSYGGDRPLLMGILNATPDSFFDGGLHQGLDQGIAHAEKLLSEGADILDVGGESSRPGAQAVPVDEEMSRVIPLVRELARRFPAPISIDTVKSEVAKAALDAGALVINDISGGIIDPRILELPQGYGAGFVINHMQGEPRTMQKKPHYQDVLGEVAAFLKERIGILAQLGLPADRIAIDPGIGFGKTWEHNRDLLEHVESLDSLGCPILLGHSRKRFIAATAGLEESDRLQPSVAVALYAALKGVSILRVHDVGATWEALRMVAALRT